MARSEPGIGSRGVWFNAHVQRRPFLWRSVSLPSVKTRGPAPGEVVAPDVTLAQASWALLCVVGYVAVAAGVVVGLHAVRLLDLRTVAGGVVAAALITAAALLGVFFHLLRRNRLSLSRLGFRRPGWRFLHLLWQTPLVVICAMAAEALTLRSLTGSPNRAGQSSDLLSDLSSVSAPVVVLAFVVVAMATPLWEEALFRGALFSGFRRRLGTPLAILLSAAVFACCHIAPPVLPFVFVLGLGLGWIRWFHRNLWASVLVHCLNNSLSLTIALLVR